MSRALKLRTSVFARPALVRTARASVPWSRLIFRYTDNKTREHLAQLQSKFTEVSSLWSALPKKFEGIDWAHWRKTIKTPGIVDQFEAEYNTEMKKEVKLNAAEAAAKKSSQEAEVRALEAKAATSAEFLKALEGEIEWTQHWHDNAEQVTQGTFRSWNEFKRDHYYPNYKIHRVNRVMFLGQPMARGGRPIHKLNNVDLTEMRKQLEAGNVRALSAAVPILQEAGDLTALQRPFIKKWIKPLNYEETFKNPTTSLAYRAFALKQIVGSA